MGLDISPYGNNYGYGTSPYMYSQNTLGIIGSGIILSLLSFFFLYMVLAWIFRSIGLYHLAKNRGIAHAWFAWVPVLSQYILGRLINNKVVLGDDIVIGHASFLLPFLTFLTFSGISDAPQNINWLLAMFSSCVWLLDISALWRLFKIYRPTKRVSYTIWSAILTSGFFIFAIRDDKPFDELEPNKIYENYYSGKEKIDQEYYRDRAEIKAQEKEDKERLRDEYQSQLNQENLTEAQKDEIRDNYYEERQAISKEADNLLREESHEYQQEIQTLENQIKEDLDPVVTIEPDNSVVITDEKPVTDYAEVESTDESNPPSFNSLEIDNTEEVYPEEAPTTLYSQEEVDETLRQINEMAKNQNYDE